MFVYRFLARFSGRREASLLWSSPTNVTFCSRGRERENKELRCDLEGATQRLQDKDHMIQARERQLQEKCDALEMKEREIHQLRRELDRAISKENVTQELPPRLPPRQTKWIHQESLKQELPPKIPSWSAKWTHQESLAQELPPRLPPRRPEWTHQESLAQELPPKIPSWPAEWTHQESFAHELPPRLPPRQPEWTHQESFTQELPPKIPSRPAKPKTRQLLEKVTLKVPLENGQSPPQAGRRIGLTWMREGKTPQHMTRGATTVIGHMAYFMNVSGMLRAYDSQRQQWVWKLQYHFWYSSLAVVRGLVTAIGGQDSRPTNKLMSVAEEGGDKKWVEKYPPMPTKRYYTATVTTENSLVVAGGENGRGDYLDTVEVMNTETLEWSTAATLPHPFFWASSTICGDKLYMLGGFDQNGDPANSVLTCSLASLLQSCQPQSLEVQLKTLSPAEQSSPWQGIANVPVTRSTCTTLCGQLLAVGGDSEDSGRKAISVAYHTTTTAVYNRATTAVYQYNPTTDTWEVISHMPDPHSHCLVATLPGNKLMVVEDRNTYLAYHFL